MDIVNSLHLTTHGIIWRVIDSLYPPLCIGCGRVGFEICPSCQQKIDTIGFDEICFFCGNFLEDRNKKHNCRNKKESSLTEIRTFGYYTGLLKKIIRDFKFNRRIAIIRDLTPQLKSYFLQWIPEIDLISPVPLTNQRKKQRGYNQSAILGKTIATLLRKDYSEKAIHRIRETHTQVGLNFQERTENVKGAFEADETVVKGKSILLIDDITTTGSTLNECAKAFLQSGAKEVVGFTLARAKFNGMNYRKE